MSDNKKKWTSKNYVILTVILFIIPFAVSFAGGLFNRLGIDAAYRIFESISVLLLLICPIVIIVANAIGLKKNPGNKVISIIFLIIAAIILLIMIPQILGVLFSGANSIAEFLHKIFYVKID